ncbi:hypothetical protein COW81_00655 [Candidatus Campbellbacteria bacterium CG22_combo_CG10-13_8_21_14_all_36_13]|uniref:HTH deoR-type domain-containing protein n=1 Tax=Candidatus Campbellbacteria bacterium CG22_combo_CG10-13_8_21_14_all_36_13 TaxID=1974529 RepID=A0A2H0DYX6_9BACT|nr:MAG: hypothetical protein COW81_00655 [Candidatus Campbellbacteria bacterium CG22_combo_CG10-13_8_21_14_all_36_13]
MDNNQKGQNNDLNKMSDTNDSFIEFFVKKSEKISGAIYILTNFIPANEPLRKKIRKNVLKLLSDTFAVKRSSRTGDNVSNIIFIMTSQTIPETVSLLGLSHASGFITEMNSTIIINELRNLSSLLVERFGTNKSLLVSREDLFVPRELANKSTENVVNKGYFADSRLPSTPRDVVKRPSNTDGARVIKKKNERRKAILDLLNTKSDIGVKDVHVSLPHYSEKTLQRELIKMVEEGLLTKEGDRRWSRYSLAKASL